MTVSGDFIDGGAGRILIVNYVPDHRTDRSVLVVPAFAEEMNKSRRLVRDAAAALCERGVWTLVPDLFGTGDSDGDFADARWDIWIDDLCRTVEWARARGAARFGVLVVRFGMALFSAAAERLGVSFDNGVAWQPVTSGAEVLRQLLRMKIMAIRMAGGRAPPIDDLLRDLLEGSEPIELGGYCVSPKLAAAMYAVDTTAAPPSVKNGLALRLDAAASARPLPSASVASWPVQSITGDRFWTVVEPRANPELVETTAAFLGALP